MAAQLIKILSKSQEAAIGKMCDQTSFVPQKYDNVFVLCILQKSVTLS